MNTWKFGIDNDELVKLVLEGKKTATTSIYNENENIPNVGDEDILMYDNGSKACITKTIKVIITEFKNIDSSLAYLEGEEDRTLKYYRDSHIKYLKTINPNFDDNTKVIFEIFEVVHKY